MRLRDRDVSLFKSQISNTGAFAITSVPGDRYQFKENYFAGYVQDEVWLTDRLSIVPGVRFEGTAVFHPLKYLAGRNLKPQPTRPLNVKSSCSHRDAVVGGGGAVQADETQDDGIAARHGLLEERLAVAALRPLDDTAASAQLLFHAPDAWENWRRGVDFYNEGALVWLEIDTIIQEGGYSNEPAAVGEAVAVVIDAGAVGINLEDGPGDPDLALAAV